MAYTIQINHGGVEKRDKVLLYLRERVIKEGTFRATFTATEQRGLPCIVVKPVRLVKAKPYCGNHPGECEVTGRKKPNSTYLEWNDWIKFHNIINRSLNRFRVDADVWSNPQDVSGKMWIRKGIKPRVKWDWEEKLTYGSMFRRVIRIWNQGTPDQF